VASQTTSAATSSPRPVGIPQYSRTAMRETVATGER
jgi:hypothetical protein